jgi:hypothetical protein
MNNWIREVVYEKLFSFIIVLALSLMNALSVFASEQSVTGITYTEPSQSTVVEQDSAVTPNTEVSPQAIGVGQITLSRVDGSSNVFELSVILWMPETITDL